MDPNSAITDKIINSDKNKPLEQRMTAIDKADVPSNDYKFEPGQYGSVQLQSEPQD